MFCILQKTYYPNKLVARLAGDEFIVVIENGECCEEYIKQMYQLLQADSDPIIKTLKFSYGYQGCAKDNCLSIDEIYTQVDKKMYENKDWLFAIFLDLNQCIH